VQGSQPTGDARFVAMPVPDELVPAWDAAQEDAAADVGHEGDGHEWTRYTPGEKEAAAGIRPRWWRNPPATVPLQRLAPHGERRVNPAAARAHAIQHLQAALTQARREQRRAQETEARAQRAIRRAEAALAEGE
jgi:hypothetical protein